MSAAVQDSGIGADRSARKPPSFGGINFTVLGLELRKLIRNRRTIIFALIVPVLVFVFVGTNKTYANLSDGHGNVSAFLMVSMALYGAALSTTAGGAMVSIERALGWSRQLRLTPLSPVGYIVIKMITAMVLGLCSVLAVFVVGKITGDPHMVPGYGYLWFVSALCVWVGSLVFAAFGLFIGYLLPSENVMQFLGLAVAALAFAGGLFSNLSPGSGFDTVAKFTPMYGLNQIVHFPQLGGTFDVMWAVNAVAWLVIFAGGAVWRFRLDTKRV
jgi:ABC-2 type transport system permease protein